ncbi:MAG: leishmanolysin-like peptidase [Bacillariaceae sp.]|jgi:leishmanolysin-like peptidase
MTRSTTISLLSLAINISLIICLCQANKSDGLRAAATNNNNLINDKQEKKRHRKSVIRELYGPDNGEVRKHVRSLEEKLERSRTGFMGDLDHEIPYENHPFQETYNRRRRERQLQNEDLYAAVEEEEGVVVAVDEIDTAVVDDGSVNEGGAGGGGGGDLYKPLRIRFETQALDDTRNADNAAKIDFIKTQILPDTAEFWSQALSVVPVSGNLKISAAELENREFCGDSEFTQVPTEHISTGIPDVDLVLYVSGTPSSRFCRGTTLAVAVACNFDQFDRPTAGAINVCLDRIDLNEDGTASDAIVEDNTDVLKHEVAHVLGHSSNSYRFFWDAETGIERTPRPFESRTVTCVDDVERSLILPAEDTMKFFQGNNGQRYAAIVTPKVRAMARNQFDCQSLVGAKLENQPTGSDSCTGDHWDEHDYYPEALSGVISPTTNIMSHMTLALFEDSGWYRANYTQGRMNPWGLGAGCDFVDGPCVLENDENGLPTLPDYAKGYFCSDASSRGCSPALSHKLACSVIDYFYIQPQTLPEFRFQYFKDEITMGGPRQAGK